VIEDRALELCTLQPRCPEVGLPKNRTLQLGTSQIRATEFRFEKSFTTEVNAPQVGTYEPSSIKICVGQSYVTKVSPTQIR
jgi:hypothetical protein